MHERSIHILACAALLAQVAAAPSARSETARWQEMGPPIRVGHSLVHDPVADRLILFGGLDDRRLHDDVWVFPLGTPGTSWSPLPIAGPGPEARMLHAAAFDPIGNRMVVIGGQDASSHQLGDTWILELTGTARWIRLDPGSGTPGPREESGIVYDPLGRRMLVFGGYRSWDGGWAILGDAWSLDLEGEPAWSAFPIQPHEGWRGGDLPWLKRKAFHDPVSGLVVVAGQGNWWQFDLRSAMPRWQWMPSTLAAREFTVLDPVGRRAFALDELGVLQTSFEAGEGGACLCTWHRPHPLSWGVDAPHASWGLDAVFDPIRSRVLAYGGTNLNGGLRGPHDGVLWSFDPDGGTGWSGLGSREVPTGMGSTLLVRDDLHDRLLLTGWGRNDSGTLYGRGFDPASPWSVVADSAWMAQHGVRGLNSGAHDSNRDRLLLFTRGTDPAGVQLRGVDLTSDPPDIRGIAIGAPGTRWAASVLGDGNGAIYDARRDRFVLFGMGADEHEVWALPLGDPAAWIRLDAAGPRPPLRAEQRWIYDREGDRILTLFGTPLPGESAPPSISSLNLDGTSGWTTLDVEGTGPTSPGTVVYQSRGRRIVVHVSTDGRASTGWTLDLAGMPTWRPLEMTGPWSPLSGIQSGVEDPARHQIVYFGDWTDCGLWSLAFGDQPTAAQAHALDAAAEDGAIRVRWYVGDTRHCTLERRVADGAWEARGGLELDGAGVASVLDRDVLPGEEYAYRLRIREEEGELVTEAVSVRASGVSPGTLALTGILPNPSTGAFEVRFTAADPGPVAIDLFNLAGRRVHVADGGSIAEGSHRVRVAPERLPAGVYFLRLRQAGSEVRTRVFVLPN